jgi:hypothetical protein
LGVDDLTVDGQNCNRIKVLLQERYADIGVRTCLHSLGSEQIALDTFVEGIDFYDAVTFSGHGAQFHEAIAVLLFNEIGDVGGVSGCDRCGGCDYDCCEGDGFVRSGRLFLSMRCEPRFDELDLGLNLLEKNPSSSHDNLRVL